LFITLLESCFNRHLGVDVVAADFNIRKDGYWFGEAQSRVIVSVRGSAVAAFKKIMGDHLYEELGFVTAGAVEVDGMNWGNIGEWKNKYDNAIGNILSAARADDAVAML
jgi:phosphoribosylformylglycinamidine synthase subunit PurL